MPELPEVETTRRGIAPYLNGQIITKVVIRESRLRWPVPWDLDTQLSGQLINRVDRRAKYLLLRMQQGTALLHLGMSGSLRLLPMGTVPGKHDHVDMELANGSCLRFNDPRRFGALLWSRNPPESHPLLRHLGPEPFADTFNGNYLHTLARGRRTAIKTFIMNSRVVVGVGNIYANEALFAAAIHPSRAAGRVSRVRCEHLVSAIREVLSDAIAQGGTTLRNFTDSLGQPGYFRQRLKVYGLDHHPCPRCGAPIIISRLGQRATYYCASCQR